MDKRSHVPGRKAVWVLIGQSPQYNAQVENDKSCATPPPYMPSRLAWDNSAFFIAAFHDSTEKLNIFCNSFPECLLHGACQFYSGYCW
jgi:hypothetical protein